MVRIHACTATHDVVLMKDFKVTLIIRGAIGILFGLLYGLIIGVVFYPLTHIGLDYEHPGPLIPNTVEWAWLATQLAALIAGAFAALVALIVGLLGPKRKTAAIIGFVSGLILLAILYIPLPEQ